MKITKMKKQTNEHTILILFIACNIQLLCGVLPTVAHVEFVIDICEAIIHNAILEDMWPYMLFIIRFNSLL